jgi:hypothetical protein
VVLLAPGASAALAGCLLHLGSTKPPPPVRTPAPQGSSEAKTVAKLGAVFAEASRFAPSLLLLRHLDVLLGSRGAADPNTAVGTLKLAAALQANIDRCAPGLRCRCCCWQAAPPGRRAGLGRVQWRRGGDICNPVTLLTLTHACAPSLPAGTAAWPRAAACWTLRRLVPVW